MAGDNAECSSAIQLGIRDLLMGWDEMAHVHFRAAVAADEHCALAWSGLMLTDGPTEEARNALENIFAEDIPATPQESALLSTWLRLVLGEAEGAGDEFAERAAQFRNDTLSACWAIRLLHDRYEEMDGKPRPRQQRALDIAAQLYARKPQDALVAYLRAWVEESSPSPSDDALAAARSAAEAMPTHPAAQLLCGHLLFRRGELKEAVSYLQRASECATEARKNVPHGTFHAAGQGTGPECGVLELRARLYESTLLWLSGETRASLQRQTELLKLAEKHTGEAGPELVLLRWEVRTLPLRLLMLSPQLPSDAQVAAATEAAVPPGLAKDEPLRAYGDCLRFCLVARQRAAAGQRGQAQRCLSAAEERLKQLEAARDTCAEQGGPMESAWLRACDACKMALYAADAAVYPDSADIWLQNLERYQQRPTSLLMPPVLPSLTK